MKRFWLGVGILAVLLAAGIGLSIGITAVHSGLARDLDAACEAVQKGDWDTSVTLAESAKTSWMRCRRFVASFVDHEPLEQMDRLFSELEIYRHQQLPTDYAAVCTHLSHLSEAIGESHALTWWNLL